MSGHRRYSLNQEAFDVWTSDTAYSIGWIYGDGCVYIDPHGRKKLCFFGYGDETVVVREIQGVIGSNHPLYTKKGRLFGVELAGGKLVDRLISIGKGPGARMVWPKIPQEVLLDFVRGLIDSDGFVGLYRKVSITRGEYLVPRLGFSSRSAEMVGGVREALSRVGVPPRGISVARDTGVSRVFFQGSSALTVMRAIYNRPGIKLLRKAHVLSEYLSAL